MAVLLNPASTPYKVEGFSNVYAIDLEINGWYGHEFKNVKLDELVHYDGVVVRDGVRGGSGGALYRRWMEGALYDLFIDKAIRRHCRWLQIKCVLKLNDNRTAKKRGEDGYDPAYKYDFLYDTLFHNVNAMTEKAEDDQCGDETTWSHAGYGEKGSEITSRVTGKPNVVKGGQTVIISDAHRVRPRAYIHRHKLHEKEQGWTLQGPNEVKMLMKKIRPLIRGERHLNGVPQIFLWKPHTTWDNSFSGDKIMDWLGNNGFGATMTCRRDRLPNGVYLLTIFIKRKQIPMHVPRQHVLSNQLLRSRRLKTVRQMGLQQEDISVLMYHFSRRRPATFQQSTH